MKRTKGKATLDLTGIPFYINLFVPAQCHLARTEVDRKMELVVGMSQEAFTVGVDNHLISDPQS